MAPLEAESTLEAIDWSALDEWDRVRLTWLVQARDAQLAPPAEAGAWLVWLILAGRGYGKTRIGAEDCNDFCMTHPGARYAIVAPTFAIGRDVCIEGESGVLANAPISLQEGWNRSEGRLVYPNGSIVKLYSSEKPERLRGPQHHRAWVEELAAMQRMRMTWDMLMFGLRLPGFGDPRCVVTTTPKPLKLLRQLVRTNTTATTRGSTKDNAANLSRIMLDQLERSYGGTRLGRQELEGEILDDVIGALWDGELLAACRIAEEDVTSEHTERSTTVVAVDPSVSPSESTTKDETGIIVAMSVVRCPCGRASFREPHVLVLDDYSGSMGPVEWGRATTRAVRSYNANVVVGEVNNGGDLVRLNVHAAYDPNDHRARFHSVRASKSKRIRAEPIAQLYNQGRVHHIASGSKLVSLEEQMVSWVPPDEREDGEVEDQQAASPDEDAYTGSPDRVDALVWAVTALLLDESFRQRRGGLRA